MEEFIAIQIIVQTVGVLLALLYILLRKPDVTPLALTALVVFCVLTMLLSFSLGMAPIILGLPKTR